MALTLYAHPFSSYCQKAQIPLYESGAAFTLRMLDGPEAFAELAALWPLRRMPMLVDSGRPIVEATIIVEHLDRHHPGPAPLIPGDPEAALEARFLDRFFDNYVQTPMQKIVGDALRQDDQRDARGVADARATLDSAYNWLEQHMKGRTWAAADAFTLADCAAAPALFYADWVHPIGQDYKNVRAYRSRLNARPSYARCIEEARPYRPLFPLGAPDAD